MVIRLSGNSLSTGIYMSSNSLSKYAVMSSCGLSIMARYRFKSVGYFCRSKHADRSSSEAGIL
jgi:hypothetical protein